MSWFSRSLWHLLVCIGPYTANFPHVLLCLCSTPMSSSPLFWAHWDCVLYMSKPVLTGVWCQLICGGVDRWMAALLSMCASVCWMYFHVCACEPSFSDNRQGQETSTGVCFNYVTLIKLTYVTITESVGSQAVHSGVIAAPESAALDYRNLVPREYRALWENCRQECVHMCVSVCFSSVGTVCFFMDNGTIQSFLYIYIHWFNKRSLRLFVHSQLWVVVFCVQSTQRHHTYLKIWLVRYHKYIQPSLLEYL